MEVNDNGIIYDVQMENGVEVARSIRCAFLHIDLNCDNAVFVNQELNVTLAYLDYQNYPQPNSDKMTVGVVFEGKVMATKTITPSNGIGNVVLEFSGPGEYIIVASSYGTSEGAEKKVTVVG